MKKLTLILALALLFNLTYAQQINVQQLAARIDTMLSRQFKANEPGVAALVTRNGQIVYKKGFGMANLELDVPMKADQVFRIGSITKQFTAVAILQLMEQGKLNLQDEVTRFIPDYPVQAHKITIEHLLTHTSGIPDYTSMKGNAERSTLNLTPTQMINFFKNEPLRFAPGTRYEYSNSGYYLLGYIIEKITGKTYQEYLEEKFFVPLAMSNTRYASDIRIVKNRADGYKKGANGFENVPPIFMTQVYAAGAIQSTVEDLFKWQQAVQSNKLIKKENLDKAFTRYKLNSGQESNYGYGWRMGFIQESPSIWHGGLINGFITMAMYLPKEDVFVAVFSNCECNSPVDVVAKMAAVAIGKPYEYKAIPVENALLPGYAGVYENESGLQRIITVSGNQLYSQVGRGPKSIIKAYQKDKFFLDDDAMVSLEFTRNNKGAVEKLITHTRVANEIWNKTTKPIPSEDGIKLDDKILEQYVGVYEIAPEFTITITREQDRLFAQATRQEKFEIFAEAENKFFLKINDAQLEFVKDDSGKVSKVNLRQGGRVTEAKKIK